MPAKNKESKAGPAIQPRKTSKTISMSVPWVTLQGDSVSSISPVFTKDGSYVFLVQDTSVLIVSRLTNRVVSMLSSDSDAEEKRHTAPITGMMLSTSNPLQLITCSLDGTIKTWDYLDSELHDNVHVGHAIVGMTASTNWKNRIFVAVCKRGTHAGPSEDKSKEASSTMYSVQLGRSSPRIHKAVKLVRLGKTRPVTHIGVSPDGRWLVATSQAKVHVLDLNDTGDGFTKYATETRITALAFHPDKNVSRFATGEANGKIKIWHCLEQDMAASTAPSNTDQQWQPMALTTTLHWHAHAVAALHYTPDGSQLLSGGEEGVLVLWKLNNGNAAGNDAREFVPRLGAPIVALGIASGYESTEQEYVARLADGSAVFVASLSLKPTRTFSTIKCDATQVLHGAESQKHKAKPVALDRAAGHLVLLSGHPSTLQFIDVATRCHVRDMEIVPSNRVSRPDEQVLTPPSVQLVAFSGPTRHAMHAEWMATVDGRDGGVYTTELSLKFWQWDARTNGYILNTRIDHPHDKGVTSMAFSPYLSDNHLESFMLVTAGGDGQVKTWRMGTRTLKGSRTELFWVCRSSFAYRDTVPSHVAWAPDGSLFAVAQGMFVTLWDPQTLVMQARLATPELKHVHSCDFVGRKGRYLVALGGASRLVAWDLVSQSIVWVATDVHAMTGYGDGFLTLCWDENNSSALQYIRPSEHKVECTWTVPVKLQQTLINASTSTQPDALCLLSLRRNGALVGIGKAASRPPSQASSLHSVAMADARATLFDELFGVGEAEKERVAQALEADASRLHKVMGDVPLTAVMDLFATPPHLLPPMSSMLDAYTDTILPKRPVSSTLGTDEKMTDISTPLEEQVAPRLDALDHVAQARDADLSHLTAVFDKLMSESGDSALASDRPSSRGSKSKRGASRSS